MITLERKDARKDGLNELTIVCESGHWKVIADGEFSGFWGCLDGRTGLGHCYHQGTGWMRKGNTGLSNRQMDRHWTDVVRIERKPMHSCDFILLAILFSFSLLLFSSPFLLYLY